MNKRCCRCKEDKLLEEFNKKSANVDGHERYCKECHRIKNRLHYKNNKQSYIDTAIRNRGRYTEWYKEVKGTLQCTRCPESHPAALDFHHTDPSTKSGLVSVFARGNVSKERVLAEMAKCIVLCSNCHRKEHYTRLV